MTDEEYREAPMFIGAPVGVPKGRTFPPSSKGYWAEQELRAMRTACKRIEELEAEVEALKNREPLDNADLLHKFSLLLSFVRHVVRVDQTRVSGTPLGVRAAELLEDLGL